MNIIRVRSLAAIFILTILSGCIGYPASYGDYGYRNYQSPQPYGARYPGPAAYGNYGPGNYQGYQPYREHDTRAIVKAAMIGVTGVTVVMVRIDNSLVIAID